MGCDYLVNVGPVVVINNPPVDTTEKHISCCNDKCVQFHKYGSGKFCPDCGSPIQEWIKPVNKPLEVDLYELLKEVLIPSDYMQHSSTPKIILIANKQSEEVGFKHFNLKYEPFEFFPKIEEINGNIEKFKQVFQSELNALKNIFGAENVEVRYGTIGTINC